jgi:hypothetical protein
MIVGQDDAALRSAAIADLTRVNLDDLISSFRWQDRPLLADIARRLLRNPARKFAHQIIEFDTAVGRDGLVSAARRTLPNYVSDVRVFGRERIPAGSFLALANHPGLCDALSLFGSLNRPDLLVVASRRPFLQALPHTSKHLSCLSDEPSSHAAVVRQVSAHLRNGGAALSFPAGHIEPDPNVHSGAAQSLESWAQSAGIFVRLAPGAALLPVVVSGVVWPKVTRGWLTGCKQIAAGDNKAAAALQLLASVALKVRPVSVSVQIGRPIYARDLGSTKSEVLHRAVLAEMVHMIGNGPDCGGERLA